jgi:hypothetical protein
MLTTRPQPRAFIPGRAAAVVWKADDRLIARIASHFSTGKSSIGADELDARVVHQDVAAPGLFDQRAALVPVGHVGGDVARSTPWRLPRSAAKA